MVSLGLGLKLRLFSEEFDVGLVIVMGWKKEYFLWRGLWVIVGLVVKVVGKREDLGSFVLWCEEKEI